MNSNGPTQPKEWQTGNSEHWSWTCPQTGRTMFSSTPPHGDIKCVRVTDEKLAPVIDDGFSDGKGVDYSSLYRIGYRHPSFLTRKK